MKIPSRTTSSKKHSGGAKGHGRSSSIHSKPMGKPTKYVSDKRSSSSSSPSYGRRPDGPSRSIPPSSSSSSSYDAPDLDDGDDFAFSLRPGEDEDDAEIRWLTQKLGLKSRRDFGEGSDFMNQYKDEGLEDFLDILFDESKNAFAPSADDHRVVAPKAIKAPIVEPRAPGTRGKTDGMYEEESMDDDDDDDDCDDNNNSMIDNDDVTWDSDDENRAETDFWKNVKESEEAEKAALRRQQQSSPEHSEPEQQQQPAKYLPPALRRQMGITISKTAMKESFSRYLSQASSFVDTKNDANQNNYQYHGLLHSNNNTIRTKQDDELHIALSSLLNKVTYINITPIFQEIMVVIKQYSIGACIDILTLLLLDICITQRDILQSTIISIGVLISSLQRIFGISYGSILLENMLFRLHEQANILYKQYITNKSDDINNQQSPSSTASSAASLSIVHLQPNDIKPLCHLVTLVSTFYMTNCVNVDYYLGFIRWILCDNTLSGGGGGGSSSSSGNIPQFITIDQQYDNSPQLQSYSNALVWEIQVSLLIPILTTSGIAARRDSVVGIRNIFDLITRYAAQWSSQWNTQQLFDIITMLRSNKQYSNSSTPSLTPCLEECYVQANDILDRFDDNLLETVDQKKGRRDTKKTIIAKRAADIKLSTMNKTKINTRHNGRNTLNITLPDMLLVKETGRWWVVGSGFKQGAPMLSQQQQQQQQHNNNIMFGIDNLTHYTSNDNNDNDTTWDTLDDGDDDGATTMLSSSKTSSIIKRPTYTSNQLIDLASQYDLTTPIQKYIYITVLTSSSFIDAYNKILTHHRPNDHLLITKAQYNEVAIAIIKGVITEESYNQLYSLLLIKLLGFYPQYRFPCVTAIWDVLRDLASQSVTISSSLASTRRKDVIAQKQAQLARITQQTVQLAQVCADLIVDGTTIDLYILRKLPIISDITSQTTDWTQLLKTITLEKIDDTTALFIHSLLQEIATQITTLSSDKIASKPRDIIAPLHKSVITNYLTLEKDTLLDKYNLQRKKGPSVFGDDKAKIEKARNIDGPRILALLHTVIQGFTLPLCTEQPHLVTILKSLLQAIKKK